MAQHFHTAGKSNALCDLKRSLQSFTRSEIMRDSAAFPDHMLGFTVCFGRFLAGSKPGLS